MGNSASVEHRIKVSGVDIYYSIYTSRRTRRLGIVVDEHGGVRVRVPPGTSLNAAEGFLASNARWVVKAREKMMERRRRVVQARDGTSVPHFGSEIALHLTSGVSEPHLITANGAKTLVLPSSRQDGKEPLDFLRAFYMGETASYLSGRIVELEKLTKLHSLRYELKEFRSKWGSCSPSGTIRFNSKLSVFPEDVIDYVIIHELCHLRHRSHGDAFWQLVSSFLPDYRERKEKLRRIALETAFEW